MTARFSCGCHEKCAVTDRAYSVAINNRAKMKGRGQNLTNAQFPILNSHPTQDLAMYARGLSPRIRIENWELSIGQIDDHVPDIMRTCLLVVVLRRFPEF